MAKKCLACDQIYAGELKLCPGCGKTENVFVADKAQQSQEPVDGMTLCGFCLLFNGAITLALPKPQIGILSIILGVLLLLRIEKAVGWVKALQFLKLLVLAIVVMVSPHWILLLAFAEPLVVLGLLSNNEQIVRLSKICFGTLILLGIIAVVLSLAAKS
jgi:hypothetical protein